MSKVEELEKAIEKLPEEDFEQLSAWITERRKFLGKNGITKSAGFRDHSAFLNSYSVEDEGLYDDAKGR